MYQRLLQALHNQSFFLFGPRGSGKTTWLRSEFPNAFYIDLLDRSFIRRYTADPSRLKNDIPAEKDTVIIDEVQNAPELLNTVHQLIEESSRSFILTGSSARKLRKQGTNLLAGRALVSFMYPLTVTELGNDFFIQNQSQRGFLPLAQKSKDPLKFLEAYVGTYLQEEVLQEGLTRNLGNFSRLLEVVAMSQAQPLNITNIAKETGVPRSTADGYLQILEDLLIAHRIPAFTKRAERKIRLHPKFFLFDTGVFRTIRPRGPLDTPQEIDGAALETMVFQNIIALNHYLHLGYQLSYWSIHDGPEVDFVLYGERGLIALEVKRSEKPSPKDFRGLQAFTKDYPIAHGFMFAGVTKKTFENGFWVLPIEEGLRDLILLMKDPLNYKKTL